MRCERSLVQNLGITVDIKRNIVYILDKTNETSFKLWQEVHMEGNYSYTDNEQQAMDYVLISLYWACMQVRLSRAKRKKKTKR